MYSMTVAGTSAAAATAATAAVGALLLHPASAWSALIRDAGPDVWRAGRLTADGYRPRRGSILPRSGGSGLRVLTDEDDGGEHGVGERRRKRDILKRTLGLGGGAPAGGNRDDSDGGLGGSDKQRRVRLNTDDLFRGMPGMDSLMGPVSLSLPNIMPQSYSSGGSSGSGRDDNEDAYRKQGRFREPDLLSPEETAALDLKYDSLRTRSERLVSNELSQDFVAGTGELVGDDGLPLNITREEARRIVDYAVEEEKLLEKRRLNAWRKEDMVRGWEEKGRAHEDLMERNLDDDDDILERDGVTREIIANAEHRENIAAEKSRKKTELELYQRQLAQRREVEGVVEKAVVENQGADIDDVYEQALDRIQSSRRTRLGPHSLGVLANSIPLEEGREYARGQRRQKEFLREVEHEARLLGVGSDEELLEFFKSPVNYEEERMYRSIVRRIVTGRMAAEPVPSSLDAIGDNEGGEDDDQGDDDVKSKYQLSAKETAEAYKLLGLWRDVQHEQDVMEEALGMKRGGGGDRGRPPNRLEPLFLYEEDTEETRQREKENLSRILQRGLASDDSVENSSGELLIKELLEGGVTKDRAVRLLDKMLAKAQMGSAIKASLEDLKGTILEEGDGPGGSAMDEGGDEWPSSPWLFRRGKPSGKPLDLSGVFRTSETMEDGATKAQYFPVGTAGRTMPSWVDQDGRESPPLPNTSLFSSSSPEEAETTVGADAKLPPPPNTPFFQSSPEDGVDKDLEEGPSPLSRLEGKALTGGMFGTYEEQRLKKLADRVGARTEEELEELRKNVEALKEAEEIANAQLSDVNFDIAAASARLGVDMESLNLDDDGDGQIMSIIQKRPMSSTTGTGPPADPAAATVNQQGMKKAILEFKEDQFDGIADYPSGHKKAAKDVRGGGRPDIVDGVFRAKTAGRYRDREMRDADKEAYHEFVRMEQEAERKLDSVIGNGIMLSDNVDIDEYAEDIMSEMKPRPRVRGRREDFMSREEIQRERKKASVFAEDEDDQKGPFLVKGGRQAAASSSMPEWFRKEQKDLGIQVEDLDKDEYVEAWREWEREERQRKADEYLKQRGEGIVISDVLGREYFGPINEPDDSYEPPSAFDSFEARKELLLGYTELTVEDINNVVDYKVDTLATGYNQYLPRVQRPFSQYGAIFRLEGVLVDMVGIHLKAWKKVAEKYGYRIQSSDKMIQASLYKPEEAVREVLYWTDNILELRDMAQTHHAAFRDAFNEWLEVDGGKVVSAADERDIVTSSSNSSYVGSQLFPKTTPSDEEMNSMYYLAWCKLAQKLDKIPPSNDEVSRGILGGDWEDAVRAIFGWSQDSSDVYNIVVAYDEILQADYRVLLQKYGIDLDRLDAERKESQFGSFPNLFLKEGVKDWLNKLHEVDMPCAIVTHLDSSQLDAVLVATGLAEYFPPAKRVSSDCNYSSERTALLGAALRVEQRPDKCVIFDNTPHSANEAHEVCMKSVSLVDHYARYELLTADLSVGYARDLELISFMKLFDQRTDLEPVLELDMNRGLQKQQRKARTAFWDE